MNITKIRQTEWSINSIKNNSFEKKNSQSDMQNYSVYSQLPAFAYRSNLASNISFCAIKKIDKPKDFSDLDKFAEYYENKLQRDLGVKDEEDIKASIRKISKETNVSKKVAKNVLAKVTQFGSYSQLENFSKSINSLGRSDIRTSFTDRVNQSQALRYLTSTKGLIKTENVFNPDNTVDIIDKFLIDELSEEENSAKLYNFKSAVEKDFSHPTIVDGWNIQIDGKNMCYSLLGATDSYEDISIAVINEMKKTGKSLEEVVNGDIIKQTKQLLGDNVQVDVIRNENIRRASVQTILDNVNPKVPTKEEIKAIIEVIAELKSNCKKSGYNEEECNKFKENLAVYLDSYFTPYSPEKLNTVLKDKYKAIQRQVERLGKTMDDVYYFIPTSYKSFSLVTYQYAKVNNIPFDKIVQYSAEEPFDLDGKVGVILDDNLCSGDSLVRQEFSYIQGLRRRIFPDDFNLIFSPIIAVGHGKKMIKNVIKDYHREDKDFVMPSKTIEFQKTMNDHLDNETFRKYLKPLLGSWGYGFNNSSIMFPFNIPDNNSDLASLFSSFFIGRLLDSKVYAKIFTNWAYPKSLMEIHDAVEEKVSANRKGKK